MIEEKLSANKSTHEKFIEAANKKKILAQKCINCGHLMLETVLFCEKCAGNKFEEVDLEGNGIVVTYTIQSVVPEGFEDAGSYAWVVFKVDNSQLRASGFLPGIKTPADLPIGTKVNVAGYDSKHGLILQK
ncbi:MAG: nucleotide-binding protein [Thermoproteota archaeon]|nr:nucleotide-binding protein [Thermoproteota archaeon]